VIICTLTSKSPTKPEDFRPVTLLNNDYNPMAQVIANRLGPMMVEPLQPSQYCYMTRNTIFERVATMRHATELCRSDTSFALRSVLGLPSIPHLLFHCPEVLRLHITDSTHVGKRRIIRTSKRTSIRPNSYTVFSPTRMHVTLRTVPKFPA
jgi:hypothetical protein